MRTFQLTLFVLGLLGLLATSAPLIWPRGGFEKSLRSSKFGDIQVRDYDLGADGWGPDEHGIETRPPQRKRGGKKKNSSSRPKNKNKSKSKSKSKGKGKGKGKGEKGKDNQVCRRDSDDECDRKTTNYLVAEAAAKKKGKTLKKNQAYLLLYKSKDSVKSHYRLIYGVVREDSIGFLDFEATSSEMTKEGAPGTLVKTKCRGLFGAKCKHTELTQYQCENTKGFGDPSFKGTWKFVAGASPEFADPENFTARGKSILEQRPTYNIFYNNCHSHASRIANVAMLKDGEDPTVPGSYMDLDTSPDDDPDAPLQPDQNPDPDRSSRRKKKGKQSVPNV